VKGGELGKLDVANGSFEALLIRLEENRVREATGEAALLLVSLLTVNKVPLFLVTIEEVPLVLLTGLDILIDIF
jgi:hypothetical protein